MFNFDLNVVFFFFYYFMANKASLFFRDFAKLPRKQQ